MTNNKQQTAVEWFWNQLPEILPFTVDTETAVKLQEAYEEAQEMHKQQSIKDWNIGFASARITNHSDKFVNANYYYEQKYGGTNENI
jgi:hypothetical protein